MKTSKKFFALLAVLTMALTLMPFAVANASTPIPVPVYTITAQTSWGTEKSLGVDLLGDGMASTSSVLAIAGTVTGTSPLDPTQFNLGPYTGTLYVGVNGNNYTAYAFYGDLLANGISKDGTVAFSYANSATVVIPINLYNVSVASAVPANVTSGQEVTITGTVTPIDTVSGTTPTTSMVVVWNGTTSVATSAISSTGTFSLTFNAYGKVATNYYVTVQPASDTSYNGAPYFTITVANPASVTVTPIPNTIVVNATSNVQFKLAVGGTKLASHAYTGTVTLGSETATFAGTTDANGLTTATGFNFSSVGSAIVTISVTGTTGGSMAPGYYGTGSANLGVTTSNQYSLSVVWPTTWTIGATNPISITTPISGGTISSATITISGPVLEDGETATTTSFTVRPIGYGTITLNVVAVVNGQVATQSFSTTIPGYVASVSPTSLARAATTALTVVVKDPYGNFVNNATVVFTSPANSYSVSLVGSATTVVNNGTYVLNIAGTSIPLADSNANVQVLAPGVVAYIPVKILRSSGISITLDKSQLVLGPNTTLTVTVASPEALAGSTIKVLDSDGTDTGVLSYTFSGSATVQNVTLPVSSMAGLEAGTYQVSLKTANYFGTATLTFVEPTFTASPAQLLAGATTVVTFTSANVKDLTTVTKVTATGAISKITAKTATDAITATVVTANVKGTGTVTFEFNSGYKFDLPISVVYGKLSVDNATVAFGTKVLTFKPVDAAGATLAVGTPVKINLLGNEYSGYVAEGGSVSVLIPELPMGTYSVLVKVAGYQDATFSLVVAEAEPEFKTVIELAPGMDIYTVNGETKFWDATPYIKDGRTLVPIRHLAEAIGFKASWDFSDPANKMVFIFKADQDPEKDKEHPFILLIIGQPTAMVNGNLVALDVAPEILNGRTMVPLRFVVETLGYKVEWLGNTIRLMK